MSNILAVIPARAGSKRLPKKNIMPLVGKPMIVWTIEAALASGIFKDVLVSTDSEEIAELSRRLGAQAPFLRNPEDASDHASIHIATLNALERMEGYQCINYDFVIQLMPNCPCRNAEDILLAYHNLTNKSLNSQISVFKFGWMNPWWALRIENDMESPISLFPTEFKKRSQDLKELYCPSGAVWIAKADFLKQEKTFYGKGYRTFTLNWKSAIDIDNLDDFQMAEMILKMRGIQR